MTDLLIKALCTMCLLVSITDLSAQSTSTISAQSINLEGSLTAGRLEILSSENKNDIFMSRSRMGDNPEDLNIVNYAGGDYIFWTSTFAGGANPLFYLTGTGIGIKESSPNEWLEIGDTGRAFFGDGNGSQRKGLLIDGVEGTSAARIESFDYGSNSGMDLIINSFGGNVGVGISDPSHKLHINGVGRSTQSTWATSSDRRVKQNIRSISAATELIEQLNPIIFDWTDDYKKSNEYLTDDRYGFIAQEVKKVIPQMVTEVEEVIGEKTINNFNVLSTDALFPIMVKALQEQQEVIEKQQEEIEDQKSIINDIMQRLTQLEEKS